MRGLIILALSLVPALAEAGVLAAARTLPAGTVITAADLRAVDGSRTGITDPSAAIGMQTRITIYEGRPLHGSMLQPPRLVNRNQMLRLTFQRGALRIVTEGRALDDAAAGDVIRVMNMASRSTVSARIAADGTAIVE